MEKGTFDQRCNFLLLLIVGIFYHCDHDRKGVGDDEYCDDVDEVVVMIR